MRVIRPELLQIAKEAQRRFTDGDDPSGPGIREWLRHGGTYFVNVSTRDRLEVEAIDGSWARSNGSDSLRFMWAARESLLPREDHVLDARSLGWATVSSYYTGLYLLLGTLRFFGFGLLYLTADDTTVIGAAPGTSTKLDPGTYSLRVSLGSRPRIELSKKNVRGFHEGFWRHADACLEEIAEEISTGTGSARPFSQAIQAEALLSVEDLRKWLGHSGSPGREIGWMSGLRNEINYRLTKQVWAPNYREGGVSAGKLRQEVLSIVRGSKDRLGAQLRLDRDVRSMVERVAVLYRDLSMMENFPRLS